MAGSPLLEELNERSREVFRRLVEAYLDTGEPVGSRTLTRAMTEKVSAATVRTLQCVEPLAGLVCNVVLIKCATRSSSIVRGLPGRTSSYRPAMRRSTNRARAHRL